MFQLIFLLCSLTAVLGQDCITQMANCMKETKAKHDTEMVAWKAKAALMKTNADACFASNGCTAKPTFNKTKIGTWTKNNNATSKIHMEKIKTCLKQSASLVETCVSANITSPFKFPSMPENATGEHHGEPWGHHEDGEHHEGAWGNQEGGDHHEGGDGHEGGDHHEGGPWGNHRESHSDFAAKFCNGSIASANATISCLNNLKPTPAPTTGTPKPKEHGSSSKEHSSHENHFAKVCEVRDNCTKSLTDICQAQLKQIKVALCPCARNKTVKDNFTKCMGIDAESHIQKRNTDQRQGGHFAGGKPNSIPNFPIGPEIFCNDPCDPKVDLAFGGFKAASSVMPPINAVKERSSAFNHPGNH